jgi:RNA polymerase sigma-70 factor (ECF subfamily)
MELSISMKLKRGFSTDVSAEMALIERCRKQDAEAFGKLIDAYQARLYGFVRRMVPDAEEAADITQDTFIRAFQAIGRFDGRSSLRTWLFRIAYNLCIDRARKVDRTPNEVRIDGAFEEDETFELPDSRWDPEGLVLDDELFAVLETGIAAMSEKLRSVLLLHDKEDMSYEDIANVLNVPVGTVKSRLFLARAHLQNVLGPYIKGEATH